VRVYLPGNSADLELLNATGGKLAGRSGFANLPLWAAGQPDQDPEVLENELLLMAGDLCKAADRRLVFVAELPATEKDSKSGQVLVGDFSLAQIEAMFADDEANKKAILAGADPHELPLTWFGPTEILEILDFISD
jgi:hypothetical protein